MNLLKVSLLTNMVAPYRVPFFKALATHPMISQFRVLTCVEREIDRQWTTENDQSYLVKQLSGFTLNIMSKQGGLRILHLRLGIAWELVANRPNCLIIGDASWTSYIATLLCLILRVPFIVWNEITTSSKVSRGTISRLRSFSYRRASSCIASCQLARDFLIQNGCPPDNITIARNCVDNEYFLKERARLESSRELLRDKLGIERGSFALLYVGQLIQRKRVIETLRATAIASRISPIHLIIAGTGPQAQELREMAKNMEFSSLTFCGNVPKEKIAELYIASDGLVLLSEDEPWGMVVNEAQLFGKPWLCSKYVGAANELISDGGGEILDDSDDVASAIMDFISRRKGNSNAAAVPPSAAAMADRFLHAITRSRK